MRKRKSFIELAPAKLKGGGSVTVAIAIGYSASYIGVSAAASV